MERTKRHAPQRGPPSKRPFDCDSAEGGAARIAIKVALTFTILGLLYIWLSDWAVEAAFDFEWDPGAQSLKGTGFVLVTSLLVGLLTRHLVLVNIQAREKLLAREEAARTAQALSEERLDIFSKHARDPFWLVDADLSEVLFVSSNIRRLWGYSPEELHEDPNLFFNHSIAPEDRDRVAEAYAQARKEPITVEYDALHADGHRFRVEDRTAPVFGPDGTAQSIVGVSEDVTEWRRAAEDLNKSQEDLFRRVTGQHVLLEIGRLALDPVPLYDFLEKALSAAAGRIGADCASVYMCDREELHFRLVAGIGWPAQEPKREAVLRKPGMFVDTIMKSKRPVFVPDIKNSQYSFHLAEFMDEAEITGISSTVLPGLNRSFGLISFYHRGSIQLDEDLEDFLQAAAYLIASRIDSTANKRLVEDLVDALDTPICLVEMTGEIKLVNSAWRRTAENGGVDPNKVGVGVNYLSVCLVSRDRGSDEAARMLDGLGRVFEGKVDAFELEYAMPSPDQADGFFKASVTPMTVDGEVGAVVMHTDITDIKLTEKKLQQAQRLEAIGRLTGGVSHDFNNLLTVIGGNLQLIESRIGTSADEKLSRWISTARRAVRGGADLNKRLLAFARRQVLDPTIIELSAEIEQTVPLLERTLGEDIEIVLRAAEGLPRVRTDRVQVESALLNLAVNARDAMPDGGKLTIEVDTGTASTVEADDQPYPNPGGYVVVSVTDTGHGMSAETLNQVFDPFFTTKAEGIGSGLGLSMVYGFLKQSGGYATIYSEEGIGTCIRLYFPALADDDPAAVEPVESQSVSPPLAIEGLGVLLVEDNADVRETAEGILEILGCEVFSVSNGADALTMLADRDDINLILTDVIMPGGMSGFELAERARDLHQNVRVICASGFTENALIRDHENTWRGDAWLSKPYTIAAVKEKIQEALSNPPERPSLH